MLRRFKRVQILPKYIYITVLPRVAISIQIKYLHEIKQKIERNHTFYCLYSIINHYYAGILKSNQIKQKCVSVCLCVCLFSSHLFWTSSLLDVPAGVTQDFSSIFLLRCMPLFFSREGFSHCFPSSTVKPNLIVLHLLGIYIFSGKKSQLPGFELTSQRVRRLRGYQLS